MEIGTININKNIWSKKKYVIIKVKKEIHILKHINFFRQCN